MNIAVVGASNNSEKYGFRILRHLSEEKHTVFPVNTHEATIQGLPVYKTVADIEQSIDIIDFVVPPAATLAVLQQVAKKGKYNVWIQPGAESPEVIAFLEKHKDDFNMVVYNDCIMTSLTRYFPNA